jgi:hypothetical protein
MNMTLQAVGYLQVQDSWPLRERSEIESNRFPDTLLSVSLLRGGQKDKSESQQTM